MRGAALGTEIQDVFSKDVFLKHFGDFEVPLSALPYAGQSSPCHAGHISTVNIYELFVGHRYDTSILIS